ncbi:MAG: hypothetical protein IJ019_04435 [Alphaproteobacteria bacterium]|nr:hypothetical protein [Alphaproteobacteria bacterium]
MLRAIEKFESKYDKTLSIIERITYGAFCVSMVLAIIPIILILLSFTTLIDVSPIISFWNKFFDWFMVIIS